MGSNPEDSIQGRFEMVDKSVPTFQQVDPVLRWFSNHLQPVPPEEKRKPGDPLVFTAYDLARGGATHRIVVTREKRGLRGVLGRLTEVVRIVPVER